MDNWKFAAIGRISVVIAASVAFGYWLHSASAGLWFFFVYCATGYYLKD